MNKEKFKVLIDSIKTANELMRKQIEINGRAVELLGEFITEPEQVEPETIKPEDMKAGEWYVAESLSHWLFEFQHIRGECVYVKRHINLKKGIICHDDTSLFYTFMAKSIRKATQEEILKYFPHELEVPTHGVNDAAYIQEVTDPQV